MTAEVPPLLQPAQELPPTQKSLIFKELTAALALAALALALTDLALPHLPTWLASPVAALPPLAFALIPLLLLRRRPDLPLPDPLGIDRAPLGRGLLLGLLASLAILPFFALGLDVVETRLWHNHRYGLQALQSAGISFQGRPLHPQDHVVVLDDRRGLAVENHLKKPVTVQPLCPQLPECAPRHLPPGGRQLLLPVAAAQLEIRDTQGALLPPDLVIAGVNAEPQDQPIAASPGLFWLLSWLFTQLLVVALPEEMFFRGYVLGRLRQIWQPRRRILGTPFGLAHVLSAGLFALIHLVVIPAPQRLLVFFPALIFAWLAERSRGVFAPSLHHALANVTQTALLLLYGA